MDMEDNYPAHCSIKHHNSKIMSNNNSSNDLAYHEICGDEFHVIVAKEERRGLVDGGNLSPSISPYSTFQPSPSYQSSSSSSRQLPRKEIDSIAQYKAVQVIEDFLAKVNRQAVRLMLFYFRIIVFLNNRSALACGAMHAGNSACLLLFIIP